MNIAILYGGESTEHKISIQTGLAVAEAIKDIYNLEMVNLEKEIYVIIKYPIDKKISMFSMLDYKNIKSKEDYKFKVGLEVKL